MCSWTAAWPPWTVAPFQHSLAQGLLTPECAESERLRVFEPESDSPVDQLAYSSCAALGQRRDGLLADGVVLRKVFVSREPSLYQLVRDESLPSDGGVKGPYELGLRLPLVASCAT